MRIRDGRRTGRGSRSCRRWPSRSSTIRTASSRSIEPREGAKPQSLTDAFDEDPALLAWNARGMFFSASQRTATALFRLDPVTREIVRHQPHDQWIGCGFLVHARRRHRRVRRLRSCRLSRGVCRAGRVARQSSKADATPARRSRRGRSMRARSFAGRVRTAPRSRACCTSRRTFRRVDAIRCWS